MISLQSAIRYPSDAEAKRLILEVGRRMYEKNFVAANDGNISCRVSEDTLWTTPTGVSKGFMTEDMLVKMRLDGTVLQQGEAFGAGHQQLRAAVRRAHGQHRVFARPGHGQRGDQRGVEPLRSDRLTERNAERGGAAADVNCLAHVRHSLTCGPEKEACRQPSAANRIIGSASTG